jgi:hypothetical protein
VKILSVKPNNRRKSFEVCTERGIFPFPYAKLALRPGPGPDRITDAYPDPETGNEAFTYRLASGAEDTIHLDAVLEYNQDPEVLGELILHRLTLECRRALEETDLSKRALIRALGTSPSQFYRLLDPTYYGKSVGQMAALLRLLGKRVEVVVRSAGPSARESGEGGARPQ